MPAQLEATASTDLKMMKISVICFASLEVVFATFVFIFKSYIGKFQYSTDPTILLLFLVTATVNFFLLIVSSDRFCAIVRLGYKILEMIVIVVLLSLNHQLVTCFLPIIMLEMTYLANAVIHKKMSYPGIWISHLTNTNGENTDDDDEDYWSGIETVERVEMSEIRPVQQQFTDFVVVQEDESEQNIDFYAEHRLSRRLFTIEEENEESRFDISL